MTESSTVNPLAGLTQEQLEAAWELFRPKVPDRQFGELLHMPVAKVAQRARDGDITAARALLALSKGALQRAWNGGNEPAVLPALVPRELADYLAEVIGKVLATNDHSAALNLKRRKSTRCFLRDDLIVYQYRMEVLKGANPSQARERVANTLDELCVHGPTGSHKRNKTEGPSKTGTKAIKLPELKGWSGEAVRKVLQKRGIGK